ncbi:MAG: NAD(P)H-binding protein, partial [Fibrobacteria bacterium]
MSQSNSQKILVVGASGTVASEVVRLLRAQGHSVRGTTSKPSSGSDSVTLNLLTGEGLDAAFSGIDRAFFLSPGGYADQYKILAPLIAKSKAAGLKKVVLMTAIGVEQNAEAPMRRAELDL